MLDEQPEGDHQLEEDLPPDELEKLVSHVISAVCCGCDGRWVDGYNVVLSGLRYAEDKAAEGLPWGDKLVCRYRRAVNNYCARFMPTMT
jgi:hypothetical protein